MMVTVNEKSATVFLCICFLCTYSAINSRFFLQNSIVYILHIEIKMLRRWWDLLSIRLIFVAAKISTQSSHGGRVARVHGLALLHVGVHLRAGTYGTARLVKSAYATDVAQATCGREPFQRGIGPRESASASRLLATSARTTHRVSHFAGACR